MFQAGAVRPKSPLLPTLELHLGQFLLEGTKRLLRVGKLAACGCAKGSCPSARPPREFLRGRRPDGPEEPTCKLEAGRFRRFVRRLDKPPGCRGSVPFDPNRAGHRGES